MASLTHVCMWKDKGWKRITAHEAASLHPGGTVSAHSGLFMCELCGQYVLLTDSAVQVRHFRHSSSEKSKNCPERTFGAGAAITYGQGEHDLPIRITNITNDSFSFEMGFVRVPKNMISSNLRIEIHSRASLDKTFVYLRERINMEKITYLPIGDTPSEKYTISVTGANDGIYYFWPKTIAGIDPGGTFFDAKTGKCLVADSDVTVGKKYYLLKRGFSISGNSHVSIKEICSKRISWDRWKIYEVIAKDYDEKSARFFLDYHCRLTEKSVSIQVVWPVFEQGPYLVRHNQKNVMINVYGNAPTTNVFPSASISRFSISKCTVLEIACNNRQQLISAGRTKALQYTYFWQEPLAQITEKQNAVVTDLHNTPIQAGIYHELINDKVFRITIPYDGQLVIKKNEMITEKRKIQANIPIEVDNLVWDMEVIVYVGADRIWNAKYIRLKKEFAFDEMDFLKRIQKCGGAKIAIPHTAGSIASKLIEYPLLRQWLYQGIRKGRINEKAYQELRLLANTSNRKK